MNREIFNQWSTPYRDGYLEICINPLYKITPTEEEYRDFKTSNANVLLPEPVNTKTTLYEQYKREYYDFDIRTAMKILKNRNDAYYKQFLRNDILSFSKFYPIAIMSNQIYKKFCDWVYPILSLCEKEIKPKFSVEQKDSLSHLAEYLFSFYFDYEKTRLKILYTSNYSVSEKPIPVNSSNLSHDRFIRQLIIEGKPEAALRYFKKLELNSDLKPLFNIIEKYYIEKRHLPKTFLDEEFNIEELCTKYANPMPTIKKENKILIIKWDAVNIYDFLLGFERLGFKYDICDLTYKFGESTYDHIFYEDNAELIKKSISEYPYRFVISLNFSPLIAESCHNYGIPYLAWEYDSPSFYGNMAIATYDTTNIFQFDSLYAEGFNDNGIKNIHYLPLAVNTDRYDSIICTQENHLKYDADLSFVGQLYISNFSEALNYLDDYSKAYIKSIIDLQQYCYCYNYLTQNDLEFISHNKNNQSFFDLIKQNNYKCQTNLISDTQIMKLNIPRYLGNRERVAIISLLSKHHTFKLYSQDTDSLLSNVLKYGIVAYETEMPLVFKCSKINLNSTLRSIQSGIPLRCLDILGCHGALLTNHQRDFDEHFKDGENVILYESYGDASEKVNFYLSHEAALNRVRDAGYETVKKFYSYEYLVPKMLSIAGV